MAKKSKRNRTTSRVSRVAHAPRTAEEFNPDYTEIKSDLKRIGTLASIFLAILIGLSFVL